jgi:hypothetical protein
MSVGQFTYSNSYYNFVPGIAGQGTAMPTNSGFGIPLSTPIAPNPTSTTSTSLVMAGIGGAWKFTPLQTGMLEIGVFGSMNNGTTGDGTTLKIAYGTGTAPVNGAAATGTLLGNPITVTFVTGEITSGVPFSFYEYITGLTVNTQYWFDIQFESVTGGTSSLTNLHVTAEEAW